MARNSLFKAIPMSRAYCGIMAVITVLALTFLFVEKIRMKQACRTYGSREMIGEFKRWAEDNGIGEADLARLADAIPVDCIYEYTDPDRIDSLRSELDIWRSLETLAERGTGERKSVLDTDLRHLNLLVRDSTLGYPDSRALALRRMKIAYLQRMQMPESIPSLKEEIHDSLTTVNDELSVLRSRRGVLYSISIKDSRTDVLRTYVFVTPEDRLDPTFVLMQQN